MRNKNLKKKQYGHGQQHIWGLKNVRYLWSCFWRQMCSILCKRVARVKIFCGAGSKLKKPNPLPLTSLQHIYSNPKLEMVIKRLNIQIMRGCKNQRTNLSNVCWPVMTNSVGWQTQLQNNLIMCTVKLCTWVNLNCLFDDKIWLSGNFSGKIIWLASLLQRGFFPSTYVENLN